jgi:hypothetical protein
MRALSRWAVPMAVSAVVVVVAVSAVAQIGAASGPYRRTVDRGYVALAQPLVVQSNTSGAELVSFLRDAHALGRIAFFSDLDRFVADTTALQRRYDAITPPDPVTGAGCATAMADRAAAVSTLRSTLEDVVGGPTGLGVVDQTSATSAVSAAGVALRAADASWAACRAALRRAPGSPRLAASVWVPAGGPLDAGAAAAVVAAVAGSASLAPVHSLVLPDVVTDPPAVVSGQTLVVPATTSLVADVVVADRGNVAEEGVELGGEASLIGVTPKPVLVQRTLDFSAGRSTTVLLPAMKVEPGSSYTVQVVAESPRSSGTGALASRTIEVQVQPVATLTSVTSAPLVALQGRPVDLIADVSSSLAGVGFPTGTVAFADDGVTVPGCGAQPVHEGQATCTVTYSAVSAHAITGQYSGDARNAGSMSPAITLKVDNGT